MTKEQKLASLRAVMTSAGAMLATWGFTDPASGAWMPVVGIVIAAVSAGWGVVFHRDPDNPGKLRWSLVRKLANATGTALVTYGFVSDGKAESMMDFIGTIGPFLAMFFAWIDNDDDPTGLGDFGGMGPAIILFLATMLLSGCVVGVDEQGNYSAKSDPAFWAPISGAAAEAVAERIITHQK